MKKIYQRTCLNKDCKKKFTPVNATNIVCGYPCSIKYAQQLREKAEKKQKKDHNKWKKAEKEKLKTKSDYLKEAQVVFNLFIRTRDKGLPCISCDSVMTKKINASHYFNANNHHFVRFNEDNVHSSCEYCNQFLSGNLIEYRPRLIKKLGIDRLNELHLIARKTANYSIPELINIKQIYKEKLRVLNK